MDFVVDKIVWLKCRRLSGPPQSNARQLSTLGIRRGQRLVPLHTIPADGFPKGGKLALVGIASLS